MEAVVQKSSVEVPAGFTARQVAERAFWLAWQACGSPMGMGILRDRDGVTESDVAKNVKSNGDYPCNPNEEPGRLYGDYVFGRMMKLAIRFDATTVTSRSDAPRSDYQSWCVKYPTYQSLLDAAVASLVGK